MNKADSHHHKRFKIIRYTPNVRLWFETTQWPVTLHLTEKIIYLKNEAGTVLAIHGPSLDLIPFSLQIERFSDFTSIFQDKSQLATNVKSPNMLLRLDNLDITFHDGAIWQPAIKKFRIITDYTEHIVLDEGLRTGFQRLLFALKSQEDQPIKEAVLALAGLGRGLTPSGDDLMMGSIYALHALNRPSEMIQLVGHTAAQRTNTLSGNFLSCAVRREAAEAWHRVMQNEPGAIVLLRQAGHRSGEEAWFGYSQTIKFLIK